MSFVSMSEQHGVHGCFQRICKLSMLGFCRVFMGLPSFMLRNWFLMLRFTLPSIQVTPLIWRIPCQHLVWLLVQEDNSELHLALVVSQPVFLVACTRKFLCILFIVIVP